MVIKVILVSIAFISYASAWTSLWYRAIKDKWPNGTTNDWKQQFSFTEYTAFTEKQSIWELSGWLIQQSELRMRQVLRMRIKHELAVGFNVGLIVGKIRDEYRTMIDTYRQAVDFWQGRIYFKPPGMLVSHYQYYLIFQEYIHRSEMMIDQYVKVLERIPHNDLLPGVHMIPNNIIIGSRRSKMDPAAIAKQLAEDRVKHEFRQKYLLKKLGMPTNMTTPKKRFVNKWPVRKTWDEEFEKLY